MPLITTYKKSYDVHEARLPWLVGSCCFKDLCCFNNISVILRLGSKIYPCNLWNPRGETRGTCGFLKIIVCFASPLHMPPSVWQGHSVGSPHVKSCPPYLTCRLDTVHAYTNYIRCNKITKTLFLQIFGHVAFIKQKVRWHCTSYMTSIFHIQRLQRCEE